MRLSDLLSGRCLLIYGAGGTGKTVLATEIAIDRAAKGHRVIFGFSGAEAVLKKALDAARGLGLQDCLSNVKFVKVNSMENLSELAVIVVSNHPDLVILDTATAAYRAEVALHKKTLEVGRRLNQIVGIIKAASPSDGVVLTADVQTKPDGEERPSAESSLRFWCDSVVRLVKDADGARRAWINESLVVPFTITPTGTEVVKIERFNADPFHGPGLRRSHVRSERNARLDQGQEAPRPAGPRLGRQTGARRW